MHESLWQSGVTNHPLKETAMQPQSIRTTIAALWIFQFLNYLTYILLELTATGNFGMLKPGEHGTPLTLESVIFLVLFLLAWATLALGQNVIRWPNMLFAALLAAVKILGLVRLIPVAISPAFIFNESWGLIGAVLIIWYAWKLRDG
jgi:hypothetical protein